MDQAPRGSVTLALRLWLAVIASTALMAPLLLVRFAPSAATRFRKPPPHGAAAVSPTPPPAVQPVALKDLTPDDARAFNGTVPYSSELNTAARPFRLPFGGIDADRARDCLAAAVYYEAGDDAAGERAVAQVILNRLRHPAFPKTICGVVFQGSGKSTGCQFTFTCDGSIDRRQPSDAAWARARAIATMALRGAVFRPVGWSTHYHTDWVVPYWQQSLDKLAEVHTQLFYRWSGWWGTGVAFTGRPARPEPLVAALSKISDAHRPAGAPSAPVTTPTVPGEAEAITSMASIPGDPGTFLVVLPAGMSAEGYRSLAKTICGDHVVCRFLGWRERKDVPASLPLDAGQTASLAFSYVRDRSVGFEKALWDCRATPRPDPRECFHPTPLASAIPPSPNPSPAASSAADLFGVRRKTE